MISATDAISATTEPTRTTIRAMITDLLVLGIVLAWIGFWGMITVVHYRQGDLLAAGVTGVGFTLGGLLMFGWRITRFRA